MVVQSCLPNWSIPSGERKVTHASWKTQEAQKVTRSTRPCRGYISSKDNWGKGHIPK